MEATKHESELSIRIGRRIREMRKTRKMNAKTLSDMCGMSNQTLSRLENGKGNFNLHTLARIEEALDCTLILVPNEDLV